MTDPISPEETTIPVWEERALVRTREVVPGRVQVSTHVEEHDETVTAALSREDVEVTRVSCDIVLDEAPVVRREGATLIVPVVEEVLVVTKRYLLKEEVHITTTSRVETVEEVVRLRAVHAEVQRLPAEPDPPRS